MCIIIMFTIRSVSVFRAFSVAGPTVWNSIKNFIRDPTISADCFRRYLKTYLSARYKCIQRVNDNCAIQIYLLTYLYVALASKVRKYEKENSKLSY